MPRDDEPIAPYGFYRMLPRVDGRTPGAPDAFPDVRSALRSPNGLLAVGGDLGPERLLDAYRRGIFPWYEEGIPILWWSPDPRTVLFPERLLVPRTLRSALRKGVYDVRLDTAFREVMIECSQPRPGQDGTWITRAILKGYCRLFDMGLAHSVESWYQGELVGGLYGVAIGGVFFGESMFARRDDASKVAFVQLVRQLERWGFALIDCQVHTEHLARFGSEEMARAEYVDRLARWCAAPGRPGRWAFDGKGWEK